nr:integrase, catalytic region, zinc finger, CCHC-type, peptidase aspartic, catalytic [Tanacetum cinerariifolium]
DLLFQPMFNELLNPPPSVDNQAAEVIAPIAEVIPQDDDDSTGSPSSITVDQDAPSSNKSLTPTEIQSLVILQDVGNDNLDIEVAHMGNDLLLGVSILEVSSEQSSSTASPQSNVQPNHPMTHDNSKWTKDHPLNYIIELHEFERLEVWELVPRLDKVMVITLKWIYKVKLDELGGILKNKARLVARGYRQEEGIDFEESFSPPVDLTSNLPSACVPGFFYCLNSFYRCESCWLPRYSPEYIWKCAISDHNFQIMALDLTKFQCTATIKLLLPYAAIMSNTLGLKISTSDIISSKSRLRMG